MNYSLYLCLKRTGVGSSSVAVEVDDNAAPSLDNLCGDLNKGYLPRSPLRRNINGHSYPLYGTKIIDQIRKKIVVLVVVIVLVVVLVVLVVVLVVLVVVSVVLVVVLVVLVVLVVVLVVVVS